MSRLKVSRIFFLAVLAALAALVSAGCGGGSSDEPEELPKARYIAKADAICKKTEDRQNAVYRKFQEENPNKSFQSVPEQEEVIVEVAVPTMRKQIKELEEVGVPEGEAEQSEAILEALTEATDKAEKEPASMLEPSTNPYAKSEQMAIKFGFKACGAP